MGKRWTEEEEDILLLHYPRTSKENLVKMLPNRNWVHIMSKASALGLKRPDHSYIKTYSEPKQYKLKKFENSLFRKFIDKDS